MKCSRAEFLTFCMAMTSLVFPCAQTVSTALEAPRTSETLLIQVEAGRLTVKLKEAPLNAVLQEVGRQARIKVSIREPFTRTISLEFQQLPLEEGLSRLLRECGSMTVSRKNGRVEQLVVAETLDSLSRRRPRGSAPASQPDPSSVPDGRRNAIDQRPPEAPHPLAALMERDALKHFFEVLTRPRYDPTATLEAFGEVVESLSAEEVGEVISMLQDKAVASSKWEEALAPMADFITPEDRTAVIRLLQDRLVREVVLKSLEQVQIFKIAQAREALERGR
jgi:type II secretory pathway component GspD/PulD (secretin)